MQRTIKILLGDAIYFQRALSTEYHTIVGVRDIKLLDSAISVVFQSIFGQDLYPSIEEKAARLAYGIINNHPFIDGNKRTGIHIMLVFLMSNKYIISYTQDEIEDLAVGIAEKSVTAKQIEEWIKLHHIEDGI